jgi:two-component system LytT family response regulator
MENSLSHTYTASRVSLCHAKNLKAMDTTAVVRVESMSNYSRIYFQEGPPLVVAKILGWFQAIFPEDQFRRVHRSHLVNLRHVASRHREERMLTLADGCEVPVSRRVNWRKVVG